MCIVGLVGWVQQAEDDIEKFLVVNRCEKCASYRKEKCCTVSEHSTRRETTRMWVNKPLATRIIFKIVTFIVRLTE